MSRRRTTRPTCSASTTTWCRPSEQDSRAAKHRDSIYTRRGWTRSALVTSNRHQRENTVIDGLRLRTDTADPEEARTRLTCAYVPHRLTLGGRPWGVRGRRAEGGAVALGVNAMSFGSGTAWVDPVPFDDFVLVSQQISGRFGV